MASRKAWVLLMGLSAAGSSIIVPDEATHLYLGLIDGSRFIHGPDCYNNNDGSFSVQLVVVPQPASWMLGAMGALGVLASARFQGRCLISGSGSS